MFRAHDAALFEWSVYKFHGSGIGKEDYGGRF